MLEIINTNFRLFLKKKNKKDGKNNFYTLKKLVKIKRKKNDFHEIRPKKVHSNMKPATKWATPKLATPKWSHHKVVYSPSYDTGPNSAFFNVVELYTRHFNKVGCHVLLV